MLLDSCGEDGVLGSEANSNSITVDVGVGHQSHTIA